MDTRFIGVSEGGIPNKVLLLKKIEKINKGEVVNFLPIFSEITASFITVRSNAIDIELRKFLAYYNNKNKPPKDLSSSVSVEKKGGFI